MRARRAAAWLHLWAGLVVGGFLAMMGISGSALVFSDEIERALDPHLRVVAPAPTRVPMDAVVDAVRANLPGAEPLRLRMPDRADGSVQVWMGGAGDLMAYVDPYTGRFLGAQVNGRTPTGFLFQFHHYLFAGETGEWVVGGFAVTLLLLCITGVVVWWPGMRNLRKGFTVTWRAAWRRVNYDLHRAGGIFTLAFLVLAAFTGGAMIFHDLVQGGLNVATRSAPAPAAPVVAPPPAGRHAPLEAQWRAALAAMPEGRTTYVMFSRTPEAPFVIRKKLPEELHPNGRTFVYVDPFTAAPLAVHDARALPRGTRIYNLLYPIHIGLLGGEATRVLWVILGLAPAALFITGFMIWWGKLRAKRARARRPLPPRASARPRVAA